MSKQFRDETLEVSAIDTKLDLATTQSKTSYTHIYSGYTAILK